MADVILCDIFVGRFHTNTEKILYQECKVSYRQTATLKQPKVANKIGVSVLHI